MENKIEFLCLECNNLFTREKFYVHLKEHGLNKKLYVKKYPDAIIPKQTGILKQELINKIGIDQWNENEKKRKFFTSLEGYIQKYGEEEGQRRYKEKCINISNGKKRNKTGTIDYYLNKYGDEIGLIEWNKYIVKLKKRHTLNSLIEKHGLEEGTKRFNDFVEKSKVTLENFIKRHGEELGKLKWKEYKVKLRNNNYFCFGWWLKKFNNDYDLASEKYKEFQTRDLSWFVKKYGEIKGKENYDKWVVKSRPSTGFFSVISQELFKSIDEILIDMNSTEICFYHDKNEEKQISKFKVDFLFKNKVIEFYGVYFHMDPRFFKVDDFNQMVGLTSEQIWKKDEERMNIIKNNGYQTLIIWENDYFKNKEKIVKECIKYLKEVN